MEINSEITRILMVTNTESAAINKNVRRDRLHKAAPDLLEALNITLQSLEYINRPQDKIAIRKARAAIIKATGVAP